MVFYSPEKYTKLLRDNGISVEFKFSLDVYLVQNSRYSADCKGKYNVILSVWSSLSQVREEMCNGAQTFLKLFISK